MSRFHQQGEQFKPKHKTGSVDEVYLDRDELAAAESTGVIETDEDDDDEDDEPQAQAA